MKQTLSRLLFSGGLLAITLATPSVLAKKIALNELGQYQLHFEKISAINTIAGNKLLAKVSEKTGSNFSVFLPFSVQQINYRVNNGEQVKKSQVIADLQGYDVHHFLDEYEAAEQLYKNAEKQYLSSKKLFKNRALKQSQWIEISKNYYAAKLRFEHLNHYRGFLTVDNHENIAIIAPSAGYLRRANDNKTNTTSKQEGELLFDIIPNNTISLTTNVSVKNIDQLSAFKVNNSQCQLTIDQKENITNSFVAKVWSNPLTANKNCQFTLGQSLVVTPIYQQKALTVNKKAVFEFEDQNYIALKEQQNLSLVAIDILSSSADKYYFTSASDLTNKQALISSVSAVQGMLLNLGEE